MRWRPSWVFGLGLKAHPTSESYMLLKSMRDGTMASGCPDIDVMIVDVRDVAQAHVSAAFTKEAKGRYIVSGHDTTIPKMAAPLAKKLPDYPVPVKTFPWSIVWLIAPFIRMPRRSIWRGIRYVPTLDNSKSKKDLGMEYRSMEETFSDMFQQMIDDKIIPEPKK